MTRRAGHTWSAARADEIVELAIPDANDERHPLGSCEPQYTFMRGFAVAEADMPVAQAGCLDAVAISEAE